MDNVRVLGFRRKKVAATTVAAAQPTVGKLLTIPTNAVLEGEGRDEQDVSVRKV